MPDDDHVQPGLNGWLPFSAPGEPLVLHHGQLRLTSSTLPPLEAPGQVTISWNQGAQLRWIADLPGDGDAEHDWRVWSDPHQRQLHVDVHGRSGHGQTHSTSPGHGWLNGLEVGERDAALIRLIAHWVNLPRIWPTEAVRTIDADGMPKFAARWQMQAEGWELRIDSRPDLDEVLRACKQDRSFAVTHVMEVRRLDRSTFTGQEVNELLEALQFAVSFALSRWSCPAAPVGYTEADDLAWSVWRPLFCDQPGRGTGGWWFEQRGEDLAQTVAGFLQHWQNDKLREPLKFAATSAIVAGESGFVEQRLVTATSALEHLCWVTDVLEGDFSATSFAKGRDAGDRLRALLTGINVCCELREDRTPTLLSFAQEHELRDGPAAVMRVRNRLVHPKDTRSIYDYKGLVAEASRLATRYLDLVVLHRIGFTGEVADRTRIRGWHGETEPVPWIT